MSQLADTFPVSASHLPPGSRSPFSDGAFVEACEEIVDPVMAATPAARMSTRCVHVTTYPTADVTLPFGGYQQPGWGRRWGADGVAEDPQPRSVLIELSRPRRLR